MTEEVTPQPKAKCTIRAGARLAGVSVGTVSAVINNNQRPVAPATRERVLRCIAELNFEPNSAARGLKYQRISSIGLIVPDLSNAFFTDIAEGIQSVLDHLDCLLVMCITWSDKQREAYYAKVLRTQRLNGVIYLSGTGLPSPSLLELADKNAVVFVDECLPGVDIPFVSSQNLNGARELARYVLAQGHRRLFIVSGPQGMWTSEQRLAGFREAFVEGNIAPDSVPLIRGDYTEAAGQYAAQTLLAMPVEQRPTVVMCANDLMAMGFIRYCEQQHVRVPEDISVTGFDDIAQASHMHPPLTTVRQPGRDMGRAAATLLLRRIGVNVEAMDSYEFATELRIRDSVSKLNGVD